MPKLVCLCGYVHDLSPIPDDGYLTIRDRDYDVHADDLKAEIDGDQSAMARTLPLWGRLYVCPECGRLAWSTDRCVTFRFFMPERAAE